MFSCLGSITEFLVASAGVGHKACQLGVRAGLHQVLGFVTDAVNHSLVSLHILQQHLQDHRTVHNVLIQYSTQCINNVSHSLKCLHILQQHLLDQRTVHTVSMQYNLPNVINIVSHSLIHLLVLQQYLQDHKIVHHVSTQYRTQCVIDVINCCLVYLHV